MYKLFEETLSFDDVLLVPRYSRITSRSEVNLTTTLSPRRRFVLDIPLISANMDTVTEAPMAILMARMGGLGIIHRFMSVSRQAQQVAMVKKKGLRVGAAVGVKDGELERARAMVKSGADLIALDIAHGHSRYAIDKVKKIRALFPDVFLVAGNVATAQGFTDLVRAGADAVKVGIGAGSICTTRIVTGFGIPQVSAILECAPAAKSLRAGLIADGGVKSSGDVVKALAAGGHAVMVGNLLAGTDEAPGRVVTKKGKRYKKYRGMASLQANLSRPDAKNNKDEIVEEGVVGFVPYKGQAGDVIKKMIGGVRSGLSYGGAKTIAQLQRSVRFVRITPSGFHESGPHDIYLS